jgi:hypothetical protein
MADTAANLLEKNVRVKAQRVPAESDGHPAAKSVGWRKLGNRPCSQAWRDEDERAVMSANDESNDGRDRRARPIDDEALWGRGWFGVARLRQGACQQTTG